MGRLIIESKAACKGKEAMIGRDEQSRSSIEMNDPKGRPPIGGDKVSNMEQYDTIFLCYPRKELLISR
ncbi:MAG: hypothetical protein IKN79_03580 [Eubacterium sp.]|nr:hypothetical protein [Eubacterium sp.]